MFSLSLRVIETKVRRVIQSVLPSFIYSEDHYSNFQIRNATFLQVADELPQKSKSCRYFVGKTLYGHNFDASVDKAKSMKDCHFSPDIINHKGVFAELNLHFLPDN